MAKNRQIHLPPQCGDGMHEELLNNPYQQSFMSARRARFCLNCKTIGATPEGQWQFVCPKCKTAHNDNLTAPRVFRRMLVLSGRGGGKTLIGAHAAREEMLVPNSIGWVMGPTYKVLHDSTFPTLIRLIPQSWVKRWDPEHLEIRLTNNALVAFRSLEDPERARGPHGVGWGWFDEAAQCPKRAYDVFEPTLTEAGGIVFCTTTVLGYDWTYDEIEKRAFVYKEPSYWACRYWSEENPLYQKNPSMLADIETARRTKSPEFFAQEYRAERHNATGLIYDYKLIESLTLKDDAAVREYIPEWPQIDASRQIIVGLDSGADHPFGAVKIVVTERGLVVVDEYLERMKAVSQSLVAVAAKFHTDRFRQVKWAANKNEANLRLEGGLLDIGIIPAESKHEVGIQRVQAWLYSRRLFYAYTAPKTIEQSQAYRYADNLKPSGEKKTKEEVFKFKDELPDALRYAVMAWPQLPEPAEPITEFSKRLALMDEKTRFDVERMHEFNKRDSERDLQPADSSYPIGDFFAPVSGGW